MAASTAFAQCVIETLARINAAWRNGQPRPMAPLLDERVAMALPDFAGRVQGREAMIGGFETFVRDAQVHEYRQGEVLVDGTDATAVAQYPFDMVYERAGARWRSRGWDVWVFTRRQQSWIAVWRTMQAVTEEPAGGSRPAD